MEAEQEPGPLASGLRCPLCSLTFAEPLELPRCQHFFCRKCIFQYWQEEGQRCPECGTECEGDLYRINPLLSRLLEYVRWQGGAVETPGHACSEHGKELERYCLSDSELICLDCRDSRKHLYHEVLNHQDAVQEFKEQLKESVKELEGKIQHQTSLKEQCEALQDGITKRAEELEAHVTGSFRKLHAFLQEEEDSLLQELGQEREKLQSLLRERTERLNHSLEVLRDGLREVQKELEEEDAYTFLQNLKETLARTRPVIEAVEKTPLALNGERFTGPIQFWTWKKMFRILDVVPKNLKLDPNTASPFLVISDGVKVRCGDKKRAVPEAPERFDPAACVLGCGGFEEGRHYWEVAVGQKAEWGIGVARGSASRKGEVRLSPEHGFWTLVRDGRGYGAFTLPLTPLAPPRRPQRVGVLLDWGGGGEPGLLRRRAGGPPLHLPGRRLRGEGVPLLLHRREGGQGGPPAPGAPPALGARALPPPPPRVRNLRRASQKHVLVQIVPTRW
ncbi:nuclear factor 7, ovary-like [Rhinatrema bivittatum]|uniref:nuclear factor 7, ovary-like n=1 Tax=Rhinatrema bivittatum TaxID=194408 RepID=UPI00112DDF7E|nr:nuclear factor 7, ovary-like [Rhinatrema bivittatum]